MHAWCNALRDDTPWFDFGGVAYATADEIVTLAVAHELLRTRFAARLWCASAALLLLMALVPRAMPT